MTAIRFEVLAELRVEHEYFRDAAGVLRREGAPLSIAPAAATQRSLRNHGVLFKRIESGFTLLYEVADPDGTGDSPKRPIAGPLTWSFVLRLEDAYLPNYSQLPLNRASNRLFHLTNRQPQPDPVGATRKVTAGDFLSASDLLEIRSPRFSEKLSSPVNAPLVTVHDAWDEIMVLHRVQAVEGEQWLHVDLGGRGGGRF